MAEESPEKLFKHAVWDAGTTIVYVLGALVVHYMLKVFGPEGAPIIVKIGLVSLEIGFVLVAFGSLITAGIIVVRNVKDLVQEFTWTWFRTMFRASGASRGRRWLKGISCSVLVFTGILVAAFVQHNIYRTILIAGIFLLLLIPYLVRQIASASDDHLTDFRLIPRLNWPVFMWLVVSAMAGVIFRVLNKDIISELLQLFHVA